METVFAVFENQAVIAGDGCKSRPVRQWPEPEID